MKDFLKIMVFNIQLLKGKKYFLFVIICLILPIALNLSTTIYFEMIIPISGTFLFSDIMAIEQQFGLAKQCAMTPYNKGLVFIARLIINFIFYIVMSFGFYAYLTIIQMNSIKDTFAQNDLNVVVLIFIVGGINFAFFGMLSAFTSLLAKSTLVGLLVSLLYGIVWMGQYTNFPEWLINPYPYSAGIDDAYKYKIIYLIFSLILGFMEYMLSKQRYGEFNY